LLRAERYKRLRVYDRALTEIKRAEAVAPRDPEPFLYEADFWAGLGLFTQARSVLNLMESRFPGLSPEVAPRALKLADALREGLGKLRRRALSPLAKARLAVAGALWITAEPHLARLLREAESARDFALADRAARLLAARNPSSVPALAFLARRTESPALLIPHIHYLWRLVRVRPGKADAEEKLRRACDEFLGKEPGGKESNLKNENR